MTVTLTFHGAAGTVTGSHYVLETPAARIAVDCGMFQGPKILKELNYQPLPSDPARLDAVVQTHAHTDHSGMLPKLVKSGFKGPIFATEGTRDLLEWMLPDSASIQEAEVERLNRENRRRGRREVEPVYSMADAQAALRHIRALEYDTWQPVAKGMGSLGEVEAAKARLEKAGVAVLGITDHKIIKSIYFFDPNGIRVELTCELWTDAEKRSSRAEARPQLDAWTREKQALRASGEMARRKVSR